MPETSETVVDPKMAEIRAIVAEVLEIDPEEITATSSFADRHDADSLLAIEVLVRVEEHFGIEIPKEDVGKLVDLATTYETVARCAGW